ncbi:MULTISPECIES: histidine triad nucleotide-binding protein [Ruminococcus]|jgi:histidine triad (HIT) family protein|uniref:Histidine triad (HIT) family protein n=2 Tax=Oscillospiraceae TaxID=216572 RepID=A0A1K1LQI7_RUMFL|nr:MULTISPECIES: histidine triad nucleotide-binding protein [Ruminococcus]MBP5378195.1 histidine triad nucleotide-binding protein [Ruminococcus sp.]MBP5578853.1 histidine triad nucleotide-binding protein [Ruminococcus sp.]MCR4640008.1 histidine triad nucleotide-binding protein [Ruminococcus sp.]SEH62668.1 histidine triad (HIT) family protein [Ruminococcus flavefaciens]SFW13140.1 histidine triad (HIT) family protein [Ruminococcus flavefaciens]
MDCLFCKIIDGEIPSTKVYEDEFVFAFKDIAPIAPVHYLIIPKVHISCANEITEENSNAVAKVFEAAAKIAKAEGIESYRIINNCGDDAGQTVKHLHFHMLAGVKMGWGPESLGKTE